MALRRGEPPVLLTNYQALDVYLSEVRSIRESMILEAATLQQQQQQYLTVERHQQPSQGGDGSRGADQESSEEEGKKRCFCIYSECEIV